MSPGFKRENIRLSPDYYLGQRFYLVTICFDGRQPFGAEADIAGWLVDHLRQRAAAKEFLVHAYCVMPDHVHLLAEGASEGSKLLDFVNSFKQKTAFEFKRKYKCGLWQYNVYDHVLRGGDSPEGVAWYIWLNPVRKGMCRTPQEFAHSGSLTEDRARMLGSQPKDAWVPPWKKEERRPDETKEGMLG